MKAKQYQSTAARWFHKAVTWVKEGSPDYIPEANRTWAEERRRFRRVKSSFKAELTVDGRAFKAQGTDRHPHGARVVTEIEIVPGKQILIHLVQKRVVGFAYVRYCSRRGDGTFAIGLEFSGELMPKEPGPWNYTRVDTSGSA
jgi:PilZ domain